MPGDTMTRIEPMPAELSARHLLDRALDAHGTWATLRALVAAMVSRHRRPGVPKGLSDHLRRDLGLPPRADSALTLLQGPAVDGIPSWVRSPVGGGGSGSPL